MDPESFREMILSAAICGKLVLQDPSDESAKELVKKIDAEKERLIQKKMIKKEKNVSEINRRNNSWYETINGKNERCIDEIIPFEIPDSWTWCRLGTIVNYDSGVNIRTSEMDVDLPVIELDNIEKGTGTILSVSKVPQNDVERKTFNKGDVLYSRLRPYLNKVVVAPFDGYSSTEIVPLRPLSGFSAGYCQCYLMSPFFVNYAIEHSYGVKMPRIGTNDIKDALVPVPPANEQMRIIDCLSKLEVIIENHQTLLNKSRDNFENVKKISSQMAIQGKLVSQDSNDESVLTLLNRIEARKQKFIEEGKLKKNEKQSQITYRNGKWLEILGKEESEIDPPFQIPESWTFVRLKQLGIFNGGKTPSTNNPEYWDDGSICWVSSKDVKKPVLDDTGLHITKAGAEGMQIYPAGSLVFVMRSGILARTFPVSKLAVPSTVNQDIKAFILFIPEMADYIQLVISSMEQQILKECKKDGTTVQSIEFEKFANILIPIPPLDEQKRIVEKIGIIDRIIKQFQ